jgi:hypothetical protein
VIAVCSGLASLVLVVAVGSLVVRVRQASDRAPPVGVAGMGGRPVLAGAVIGQLLEALGVPDSITSYFNTVRWRRCRSRSGSRSCAIVCTRSRSSWTGRLAAGLAAFVTLVYLVVVAGIGAAIASSGRADRAGDARDGDRRRLQPLRARLHRRTSRLAYRSPIAEPDTAAEPAEPDASRRRLKRAIPPEVAVRTLGASAARDGEPVPASAWQSGATPGRCRRSHRPARATDPARALMERLAP